MENQPTGNGDNTRIYERALELSKARITDLTWNNILFEANLDVKNVEAEERDANVEISRLQLHVQELNETIEELSSQRDDFEDKHTQLDIDYGRLQKLDDVNATLRTKIANLQNTLGDLETEDIGEIRRKIEQLAVVEGEKEQLKESLSEANSKLTISDKTSSELINENNQFRIELEELRPKIKLLEAQAIKGRSSTDAYSELEQEFLKREQKYNEMQLRHNKSAEEIVQVKKEKQDVEAALVTQKKIYTELVQRSDLKDEEHRLEIEKLSMDASKPAPKKRGRPKKENNDANKDGGVLD